MTLRDVAKYVKKALDQCSLCYEAGKIKGDLPPLPSRRTITGSKTGVLRQLVLSRPPDPDDPMEKAAADFSPMWASRRIIEQAIDFWIVLPICTRCESIYASEEPERFATYDRETSMAALEAAVRSLGKTWYGTRKLTNAPRERVDHPERGPGTTPPTASGAAAETSSDGVRARSRVEPRAPSPARRNPTSLPAEMAREIPGHEGPGVSP